MKKIIYLSIALVTLTLTSCRNQDDMVQLNDVKPATTASAKNDQNSTTYQSFDSSAVQQGDPTKPPQE